MNKKQERRGVVNVEDRKVEIWIRALGFTAMLTLPLIGFIGSVYIDGQKEALKRLDEISLKLSQLNAFFKEHEARISRNEQDIRTLNNEVFQATRGGHNGLR